MNESESGRNLIIWNDSESGMKEKTNLSIIDISYHFDIYLSMTYLFDYDILESGNIDLNSIQLEIHSDTYQ